MRAVALDVVFHRVDLRGVPDIAGRLPRPEPAGEGATAAVADIVASVRAEGDAALERWTREFDGTVPPAWQVPPTEIQAALAGLGSELREALETAATSVSEFHAAQLPSEWVHRRGGITVRCLEQPVARAGCYVPGGRAAYPSTVLMTSLVARAAGVTEVALCVPPGPNGRVSEVTLAAAAVADVTEVYAVGGAQAVAALAYGTESVAAVDVIVGPGNIYVALAKQLVARHVGVPAAFAGPSEVVVVADAAAEADYVAVDLMAQAEHGPDGMAWLVTWESSTVDAVDRAAERLLQGMARREDIADTLRRSGYAVLVDGPAAAAEVVNLIAPEHLQVMTGAPAEVVDRVRNAAAVFCGPLAPAAIGDYVAGPSHVLPTSGSARYAGALNVRDFTKPVHVVEVEPAGFAAVAEQVMTLAEAEGLDAHAASIRVRQTSLEQP